MSAAASGLAEAIARAHTGTMWADFPLGKYSWWVWGAGGVGGYNADGTIGGSGSLCGVPNGVFAIMNMCGKQGKAANIMDYYCTTAFPTNEVNIAYDANPTSSNWLKVPIPFDEVRAQTVAESPLCHVSISKWCKAAGVTLEDMDTSSRKYKLDRCGKIACDVAAFALGQIKGDAYTPVGMSEQTAACAACHNSSIDSVIPAQQGNMYCGHCHTGEAVIVGSKHYNGLMP